MSFPCSGCGCCCKRVGKAIETYGIDFPYKVDASGTCEMLDEEYLCKVYEDRPLICRVDELAEVLNIPKQEFYQANISACNKMMDEDNIDQYFRIKNITN
jgi:Fe-S-cluster containining protein